VIDLWDERATVNILSEGLCALWRIKRHLKEDRQSILYSMLPAANSSPLTCHGTFIRRKVEPLPKLRRQARVEQWG
jgi:hypothetical protein